MKFSSTRNIALSGMFLALGLFLPFLTGQIPQFGSMLLPMHIPVLICGFVCGPLSGLAVGAITPLLRHLLFGMPAMPFAIAMAVELAVYGMLTGFFYKRFPKNYFGILASLLLSMLLGRVAWGIASYAIFSAAGNPFTLQMFWAGAFMGSIPGIILQVVLIPILVTALQNANLISKKRA